MPDDALAATTLDRFRAEAERASSRVVVIGDWSGLARHVEELAHGERVVLAPSLAARVPDLRNRLDGRALSVEVPDEQSDEVAAEVADAPLGVVSGVLAVAETGSVLVAEHTLADRVVSMLVNRLVQVVAARDVVDSLDDIARWLASQPRGRAQFVSLMTGPSRTADIERSLTIGVQGPEAVEVVVVG